METLKTQVEVTEALANAARHSVEQSLATLRDARQNLGKTTITAPMSGRITRLNVEQGETARADFLRRVIAAGKTDPERLARLVALTQSRR